LEDAYDDRSSLFGSAAVRASAHFLDRWVDSAIHPALVRLVLSNIHDSVIVDADRSYFRSSREKRFCMMLDDFTDASESRIAAFRAALQAGPTDVRRDALSA